MTTDVQAADAGPLSTEQAISLLGSKQPVTEQPAEEAAPAGEDQGEVAPEEGGEEQSEAAPTADETQDPEDPAIEGEEGAEPESDPETPAIAAPKSWDASERAVFARLDPKAKEIILARETERDKAVSRAQSEAGEARKQAQAGLQDIAQFKSLIQQTVTKANEVFAGKWDHVDWKQLARTDAATYVEARAEYEEDVAELQHAREVADQTARAAEKAAEVEFQNYLQEEAAKLPDKAPELADPKEGSARRIKVGQFLLAEGIPAEQLKGISAVELALAYDAMQFRALKANKPAPAARPAPPKPAPRPAAPTAAAPVRTSRNNAADALAKLSRSGSTDDAMAALRARRGQR